MGLPLYKVKCKVIYSHLPSPSIEVNSIQTPNASKALILGDPGIAVNAFCALLSRPAISLVTSVENREKITLPALASAS